MKRGWFLALAVSIGLNVGLIYSAVSGPGREEAPAPRAREEAPAPQARLDRMTRSLGLDERQRGEMQRVLEETMPSIIAAREEVRQARRAVQTEYGADRPEPARVHRAVRAMNAAQARLDSLVAETMLLEIGVLGPEQMHRYRTCLPWERRYGSRSEEGRGRHGRPEAGPRRQAVTP